MRSQAGFAGQKDLYEILYRWVYSGIAPGEEHSLLDNGAEVIALV